MSKILVVEDDAGVSQGITDLLSLEKHNVEVIDNGEDALHLLAFSQFDLIILDWGLPGMDGIELCRQFRKKRGQSPILLLTGRKEFSEKETGLDAGADDYLVKPFNPKELAARVRALLRRPPRVIEGEVRLGNLVLNRGAHEVERNGEPVKLLPKEYELLEFFMIHPGQIFSLESLLASVWPSDSTASTEAVRQCIKRLRKKVSETESGAVIKSVFAVGYALELIPPSQDSTE